MERCDFSSIMTIIGKYISESKRTTQADFLCLLFESFIEDESNLCFGFDHGLVCRWFKGLAKISPTITSYYSENICSLAGDIEFNILPLLYDRAMAVREIYDLLVQDASISDETKQRLTQDYPCLEDESRAVFIGTVLCFTMERGFVKRDVNTKKLLTTGSLSPVIRDYVFDAEVPPPCRYFCGRDTDLEQIHQLLNQHGKLFVQGIPGIGKSEAVKAYAKQFRKEYTNTLYIYYSGCLKNDIADLDFADDFDGNKSTDERFRKHNRFLRSLKEDTLILIDNFNTIAASENVLHIVLKYRCHVIITTRSRFDDYPAYTVEEMSVETLLGLAEKYYSKARQNRSVLKEIIETIHRHTFAVELSARLLENGILEPEGLLNNQKKPGCRITTASA